jgi:hypothetical protein
MDATTNEVYMTAKELLEPLMCSRGDNESLTSLFRTRFLQHASDTEENIRAIQQVEYGSVFDPSVESFGLRVGDVSLSDISHGLEELDFPAEMADLVPGLTPAAWQAGLRVITVILSSLENRMADSPTKDHL